MCSLPCCGIIKKLHEIDIIVATKNVKKTLLAFCFVSWGLFSAINFDALGRKVEMNTMQIWSCCFLLQNENISIDFKVTRGLAQKSREILLLG